MNKTVVIFLLTVSCACFGVLFAQDTQDVPVEPVSEKVDLRENALTLHAAYLDALEEGNDQFAEILNRKLEEVHRDIKNGTKQIESNFANIPEDVLIKRLEELSANREILVREIASFTDEDTQEVVERAGSELGKLQDEIREIRRVIAGTKVQPLEGPEKTVRNLMNSDELEGELKKLRTELTEMQKRYDFEEKIKSTERKLKDIRERIEKSRNSDSEKIVDVRPNKDEITRLREEFRNVDLERAMRIDPESIEIPQVFIDEYVRIKTEKNPIRSQLDALVAEYNRLESQLVDKNDMTLQRLREQITRLNEELYITPDGRRLEDVARDELRIRIMERLRIK